MHRTTIYLEDELLQRLRERAEQTGQTQSSFIRDAVEAALERTETMPYPRSVGLADTGPNTGDLSEQVNELLAEGFGRDEW